MFEHFQFASPRLNVVSAIVLQSFLQHGFLTDGFMITLIILILKNKNGDLNSDNNYRPIAIATVMSIIIEMCVQTQL